MCLDRLSTFPVTTDIGWKVFEKHTPYQSCDRNGRTVQRPNYRNHVRNPKGLSRNARHLRYMSQYQDRLYARGKRYSRGSNIRLYTTFDDNSYETGFHIFIHKENAIAWMKDYGVNAIVKKVKFGKRGIVAKGSQKGFQIVVACTMRIL